MSNGPHNFQGYTYDGLEGINSRSDLSTQNSVKNELTGMANWVDRDQRRRDEKTIDLPCVVLRSRITCEHCRQSIRQPWG